MVGTINELVCEYTKTFPLVETIRRQNPNLCPISDTRGTPKVLTRKRPQAPDPEWEEPSSPGSTPSDTGPSCNQLYWKFHLLRFGSTMYLTTNPTLKHLNCKSFPGYHITHTCSTDGTTMTFSDLHSGEEIITLKREPRKSKNVVSYEVNRMRNLDGNLVKIPDPEQTFKNEASKKRLSKSMSVEHMGASPVNYETLCGEWGTWKIGSVPIYTSSRLSRKGPNMIGKQNVYFHNLSVDRISWGVGDIPPVVAMYRNCESSTRKRMVQTIHRLRPSESKQHYKMSTLVETPLTMDPVTDAKSYSRAGDGLYWNRHPKDDEPDHRYKLGWLTIYENTDLFKKPGMFDIVVALTVAVSCGRNT